MTPEPRSVEEADALTIYYGIHDALRELGDPDADVGDGSKPDTRSVISGLWDASSALSRVLAELTRLRGIEEAAQMAHDEPYESATWWRKLGAALARPDRQEEGDG